MVDPKTNARHRPLLVVGTGTLRATSMPRIKATEGETLEHEFPTPRPHRDSLMRQKEAFRDTCTGTQI